MQTIYDNDNLNFKDIKRINKFNKNISKHPFILLVRPSKRVYENKIIKKNFFQEMEKIIEAGLQFLELPWEDNDQWYSLMQSLR